MKIKINENESYELILPTSINIKELGVVINKLQKIFKIASKDEVFGFNEDGEINIEQTEKKHYKVRLPMNKEIFNSREKALMILQTHYYGTKEEKGEILKALDKTNWNDLSKGFHMVKKRYNIKPQEVGLTRYPALGEFDKDKLKIKNSKFKLNAKLWKK